jgi:hypothetical protein
VPRPQGAAAVTYTLPVVVHIISDGEAVGTGTNISQAQVQSQLAVLNEDYRNRNADGSLVPSVFQSLRGDAQVQFQLAGIDPSGRPLAEPGIDRIDRNARGWNAPPYGSPGDVSYIENIIKPQTSWNPDNYVNIWVMNLGNNLLGYAQLPDNTAGLGGLYPQGGLATTDGVVIRYSVFGREGTLTTNFDRGRTTTHEMGHFLGLLHTWGDADCGNDYVADTPTQQTSNFGCPTFPHVSCSNGPNGDLFMDFLDYVNDACMQLFTRDQADRMQAVLAAGTPRRTSLATSPALCAGVVATAASSSGPACVGAAVRLQASAVAGATYSWSGPNGFSSSQQNPTLPAVTLAQAGTYTVQATVPGSSLCPGLASTTVAVNEAPPVPTLVASANQVCPGTAITLAATTQAGSTLPSESFDSGAPGWIITSQGSAGTTWAYQPAGYSYTSSYLSFSNYSLDGTPFALANSDAGGPGSTASTTLASPVFSTQRYSALQVTFLQLLRYQPGDTATLEASTDGRTWATVATYAADQGSAATPATTTVSLSAYVGQPTVQLRWRYAANWNFFWAIDNVRFSGTAAPLNYTWSLVSGDGLPATTTTPSLVVAPTQTSVYQLALRYGSSPCPSTATVRVEVAPAVATLAASSSGPACVGAAVRLQASAVAGATYSWSGPNGFSSSQQNPTLPAVTLAQAGTYTVQATVPGSSLCPAVATTTLVVNPIPPVPQLVASSASVCPGSAAVLSATHLGGAGTFSYAWSLVSGDGLPAATTAPTLTVAPTVPSVYQLTLTYAGQSCPTIATVAVGISPPVWTGAAGDGNWFNAGNWQGCVPTRTTDALIPVLSGVLYPTIGSGAAEVRTLTVQGELTLGGGSLGLYGDFGGLGAFRQAGGQVQALGSGAQSLRGGIYLDLAIGGAGLKTIASATIGQRLVLAGGVLSTGRDSLTLDPTATLSSETNASYVLGTLRTTRQVAAGTEAFGGLGVSITAAFAPGLTTVRRVTGTALGGGNGASVARYYDIRPATGRGLQGATLSLAYLPRELNGLDATSLVLFRSPPGSATFSQEGATTRDTGLGLVTRAYVTDLAGRWTLASSTAPLGPGSNSLTINAFPVPFGTAGLSLQVTTPTAGPLQVEIFDVLGRRLYRRAVASVEAGTSTMALPGTEQLSAGKYLVRVQQAGQQVVLNVVRQ